MVCGGVECVGVWELSVYGVCGVSVYSVWGVIVCGVCGGLSVEELCHLLLVGYSPQAPSCTLLPW